MKFFHLILLPFDLLGQVLFVTGMFLWKFIGQLFLSPWGLIVPLTLLSVLFLFSQLTQTSRQIAESYAKELEFCEESKIPVLVGHLVRLGEYGIPELVQGLGSSREPVFLICRNTLQKEMERWEQLPTSERLRYYRFFSAALLDNATKFGTTAQTESILFAQKMLRNLVVSKNHDSTDSRLVTKNCEQFLSIIETPTTKILISDDSVTFDDSVVSADISAGKTARFSRGGFGETLMTARGTPFRSDISDDLQQGTYLAGQESAGDMFAVSRAERLYAYHQSPLFQKQFGTSSPNFGTKSLPNQRLPNPMLPDRNVPDANNSTEMLASMKPSHFSGSSSVMVQSPESLLAQPENKIAQNIHLPEQEIPQKNSPKNPKKNIPEKQDSTRYLPAETDFSEETEFSLPWELREITLEKISNLSSAHLMRLLHHPDNRYVSESRKTLISRDGFQDIHLKLAYRLYHPVASVRMEIISMLPNTHGIRQEVWLSALLADPDNDIRYRAASFLATAGDPAMQRLVIDKGKRDSDARIVNLADQLLEQQRHRIRR
ncbi:MAG: hypothetical protein LBP87_04420 [Planctomycetaceae bacterium]|jgi:hypothetical protein|nr:hypothetical protein [Planctomycetaceae bacterium]